LMRHQMKQAIVLRRDLQMGRGKAAAQAAHAACDAVVQIVNGGNRQWSEWLRVWLSQGQKKVVLRVENEDELNKVYSEAVSLGLPTSIIEDAGLTQLPPGTKTAVAVGPAPSELVDKVTGKLKLY